MTGKIIYISSEFISPRLQYAASEIFGRFKNCELRFSRSFKTRQVREYIQIDYGESIPGNHGFKIPQHSFINEEGINPAFQPEVFSIDGQRFLFPDSANDTDLNFDIFSAVFYMLSRYEEYLPFHPDQHGRFPSYESISHKYGFLKYPVVDYWVYLLKQKLEKKYIGLKLEFKIDFLIQPSYDIDQAWYFKNRRSLQNLGSIAKNVLRAEWNQVKDKIAIWIGRKSDPYDTYNQITSTGKGDHILVPEFFILISFQLIFIKTSLIIDIN